MFLIVWLFSELRSFRRGREGACCSFGADLLALLFLASRHRSEATVCQLLSNLAAVLMVFQISVSCESSFLFSSVLGSRGTPKASKTRLGMLFSAFVAQGVPKKLPRSIFSRF